LPSGLILQIGIELLGRPLVNHYRSGNVIADSTMFLADRHR
jgi:hypothetical protein